MATDDTQQETNVAPDGQPLSVQKQPIVPDVTASEDPPAAEPKNTENMVPQSRFNEVNSKYRELQTRLDELETEKGEREKAELAQKEEWRTLYEQSQDELTTLRTSLVQAEAEQRLERAYGKMVAVAANKGYANPDDVRNFIGLDIVEFDETGQPINIDTLVESLAVDKPYLLGGGGQIPRGQTGTPKDPTPNGIGGRADEKRADDFETLVRSMM